MLLVFVIFMRSKDIEALKVVAKKIYVTNL